MSIYKQKGIYTIHSKGTDTYYIGCTSNNFGDRRDVHFAILRNGYHHNKYLQEDFDKYGEDSLEFIVLEELFSDDKNDYFDKEKEYIAEFKKDGKCINETDGGEGSSGFVTPIKRLREIVEHNRECMLNRKLSDETREKMSKSRRGVVLTEENVYDIKVALMNGESCKSLSKKYNVTVACISTINAGRNWTKVNPPGWRKYLKDRFG